MATDLERVARQPFLKLRVALQPREAEAASAVPWTKPQDLPYSAAKPIPALGMFPDVIQAAFVDGSVHSLPRKLARYSDGIEVAPFSLRDFLTRAGGEIMSNDAY